MPAVMARALSRTARIAAWLLLGAICLQSARDYLSRPLADRLGDLHIYMSSITAQMHGLGLYSYVSPRGGPFTYPPAAALVLWPIAQIDRPVAEISWTVLTLLAVLVVAGVLVRVAPMLVRPGSYLWPLIAAVLVLSKPVQSNLRFGQVSLLLAALVLLDIVVLDSHPAQGVLTGVAAAIKLTPLLFIPMLFVCQRRRSAITAFGTFIGVSLLAAAILPDASAEYWRHAIWHTAQLPTIAETGNQSVYGSLVRADVHGATITIVWCLVALTVASIALWRSRAAWQRGQRIAAMAITGSATVVAAPISWTHHQIWLLLAAAAVVSERAAVDWLHRLAVVALMVHGLPALTALGGVGTWVTDNQRLLLAAWVVVLMPIARRHTSPVVVDLASEDGRSPRPLATVPSAMIAG